MKGDHARVAFVVLHVRGHGELVSDIARALQQKNDGKLVVHFEERRGIALGLDFLVLFNLVIVHSNPKIRCFSTQIFIDIGYQRLRDVGFELLQKHARALLNAEAMKQVQSADRKRGSSRCWKIRRHS